MTELKYSHPRYCQSPVSETGTKRNEGADSIICTRVIKLVSIIFAIIGVFTAAGQTVASQNFSFTGSTQTFVVPSCVSTMTVEVYGAQGASLAPGGTGGLGGYARGTIPVVTGQTLYIYVGGQNGFNGGAIGGVQGNTVFSGPSTGNAANGGGASDVRSGGTALSNRLIVAGGGGGGGSNGTWPGCQTAGPAGNGGAGGGISGNGGTGGTSTACNCTAGGGNGGGGGSATAGGSAGTYNGGGCLQTWGPPSAGTLGNGGAGSLVFHNGTGAGGGGGGGYYGGGAGASGSDTTPGGGGGGGSSFLGTSTNTLTTAGVRSGNGLVVFTYNFNGSGVIASATSNSICSGTTVTLTASNVISYTWTPGGSNATTETVTPTTTSSYTVQGTNSIGCISTAIITITVDPAPPTLSVANTASATGGICPTRTVMLTASGATSYSWTNGVVNGVTFAPSTNTTYIVSGANACGTTTASTSVSVHPLPSVTGVVSQPTICSGNPITLTGVGDATVYVWNGNLANGVTQFPSVNTTYTVVGTSAQGCTASALASVTVVTTPLAQPIASPPLICVGSTANLSSSGASNYSWIGQSGPFSSASSVTVAPTSTTTYTLTKSNANCTNTQTVSVIVNPLPGVFAFVNPTVVCSGKPANLSAGGAASYTWTAPPAFSVTGSSPIVSPTVSTMYTVTASDGTCINQTTLFLPTNPNPTVSIAPTSTSICRQQTVSLTASGALAYTWTAIGLASSSTAVTITESPTLSTLYSVVGENTFNCTTGANQVVVVYPNPTTNIASSQPMVCKGAPVSLTVTGANTYTWDSNAGGATTSVVIVNPQVTTLYSVAASYSSTGCTSGATKLITVFLPTFAVNSPTSSCLGGTINLIASGAQSYTWNGTSPFSQISVSPPTATVYQVAATSVSVGVTCISTNSVQVSIYANPTVVAMPERTLICKGENTNLIGTGAVNYQWSTGQTGSVVPVDPISNQTYTVLGTDQNGCIATTSLSLKVSPCFGINETNNTSQVGLHIYPNPTTGTFMIKTEIAIDLNVVSALGQILRSVHLTPQNNFQEAVINLAHGIYFITGVKDQLKINEKIVVGE